jgi:hypothetical protein
LSFNNQNRAILGITKSTYLYLLFLLVIVSKLGTSQIGKPQNLEVFTGPDFKNERKEPVNQIIGKDQNGTLVMGYNGDQLVLYNYSSDLQLQNKKTAKLVFEGKKLDFHQVVKMEMNYFLITSYLDKKNRQVTLYGHKLNRQSLIFEGAKEITAHSYEDFNRKESPIYSCVASKDGKHLICVTSLPSHLSHTYLFDVLVINKDMELVWSKTSLKIKSMQPQQVLHDVQVGPDGSVYVLAKIYDLKKGLKGLNYRFELQVYSEEAEKPFIFKTNLDSNIISDLKFELFENGTVYFIGFCANKEGLQTGILCFLLGGETFELKNKTKIDFPSDFIFQHGSEKERRRAFKKTKQGKDVGFYSFEVDDLIAHENGSVTMLAEQYSYYQNCYTDGTGSIRCTDNYIYGNIITVKFSQIGVVEWMDLVPKYQHTINDGGYFSGYCVSQLTDGSINLIFNDSPKNSYYRETGEHYGWNGTRGKTDVVVYNIEEEGKTNRYILLKGSDEDLMSRPKVALQLSESEVLLMGESRKIYRFYRLLFE